MTKWNLFQENKDDSTQNSINIINHIDRKKMHDFFNGQNMVKRIYKNTAKHHKLKIKD